MNKKNKPGSNSISAKLAFSKVVEMLLSHCEPIATVRPPNNKEPPQPFLKHVICHCENLGRPLLNIYTAKIY